MKRKKRKKAEDKDGAKDIFYKRSIRVELAVQAQSNLWPKFILQ